MLGGWAGDTAALYARVFSRGTRLALRNWPLCLVVVLYGTLLRMVGLVAAPLGIAGGFLLYLATVACLSSWLALVGQVIRLGRVRLSDLPSSFVAYLGDLLTVAFLLWGLRLIGTLAFAGLGLLLAGRLRVPVVEVDGVETFEFAVEPAALEQLVARPRT